MDNKRNIEEIITDSVLGEFIEVSSSVKYYNKYTAPFLATMEEWERKEYIEVNKEKLLRYNELDKYLFSNESVFNDILTPYNMSLTEFIDIYNIS